MIIRGWKGRFENIIKTRKHEFAYKNQYNQLFWAVFQYGRSLSWAGEGAETEMIKIRFFSQIIVKH